MPSGVLLEVAGRTVEITNPEKPFFPQLGVRKIDLVRYYVSLGDAVLRGVRDRPTQMKRYPDGVEGEFFYQKRVPKTRPEWLETVTVHFPSGRSADFLAVHDLAHIAWAVNLGCIELHPWAVRRADVDHPDELRIDLDPTPECGYDDVRRVAAVVRQVLREHRLRGFPKTSGKRGLHVYVRIEPRWGFTQVRRAALALAREVERRSDGLATTQWWKELRHGVFVDYNQNARDRTVAAAYSVRPVPDARVSCPLAWDEVAEADPADLRIDTVPGRVARMGDTHATIDDAAHSLESLLELADRDEREGLGDAPWPPHFPKASREPTRAPPSRRRTT